MIQGPSPPGSSTAIIGDTASTSSIRLHEAAGFTTVGVMPGIGYKHDRWLDSVVLTRALGAGKGPL